MFAFPRLAAVATLAWAMLGIGGPAIPMGPARAATATFTVLLVNDIYQTSEQTLADGQARGGFARLAAVVKAERAKGGRVILAHGGDTLSPSLMSGLDRGEHIITLTNLIAPDIFVPGNHEFDFGKAIFSKRMAEATFPLYAANLRGPDGLRLPGFRDRHMLDLDGVRIGLTGVAHDETPRTSSPEDLAFLPSVATLQAQADLLRREGADIVLAVAHVNRSEALALYAARSADLLLTGHTHDLFIAYDGHNALIESGYDAHMVTAVDVTVSVTVAADGRRRAVWWPRFRVIDTATVVPDPEVAALVATFEAELAREMDVPLATTQIPLDSRNAAMRTGEAAIGSLLADAMRITTGADVAVMNGGGIRAGKVYPANTSISRRDVLAELPFGNRVVVLEVSGAAIRAAIENGLSRLPDPAGRFPHVSGLTVDADRARPPGQRITAIAVGETPLDPARTYTLATNDFLARGSDGYDMFGQARRVTPDHDARLLANEVMVYLRRLGTITDLGRSRLRLR